MRMRKKKRGDSGAEVLMSPLIDCVFLLLIFFLVTSQLKRWERQIPVTLADPTASVAISAENDVFLLGIDTNGQVYREGTRSWDGKMRFIPIDDLPGFLQELAAQRGLGSPIEISVERKTPFQTVIQVLDILQLQGFTDFRSRVRDTAL